MNALHEQYNSLLRLILPEDIFEYFEITSIDVQENKINAYFDELNQKLNGFENEHLVSKGFHNPIVVQDFPLRDKPLFLHVRRRRSQIESSGKTISRDWNTVAQGTRMTKGFAAFLKGIFGQLPNKQQ